MHLPSLYNVFSFVTDPKRALKMRKRKRIWANYTCCHLQIAAHGWKLLPQYQVDPSPGLGRWVWRGGVDSNTGRAGKGQEPVPVPTFPYATSSLQPSTSTPTTSKEMGNMKMGDSDFRAGGLESDCPDPSSTALIRCQRDLDILSQADDCSGSDDEDSHIVRTEDKVAMIKSESDPVPVAVRYKGYLDHALSVYNDASSWAAAHWQVRTGYRTRMHMHHNIHVCR